MEAARMGIPIQILKETSQIWHELEEGVEQTLRVPTGLW